MPSFLSTSLSLVSFSERPPLRLAGWSLYDTCFRTLPFSPFFFAALDVGWRCPVSFCRFLRSLAFSVAISRAFLGAIRPLLLRRMLTSGARCSNLAEMVRIFSECESRHGPTGSSIAALTWGWARCANGKVALCCISFRSSSFCAFLDVIWISLESIPQTHLQYNHVCSNLDWLKWLMVGCYGIGAF